MSPRPTALPVLFTVRDVSERLGVSIKTVRREIQSGELHTHRVGRSVRMSLDDVAAYIAQRRR